MALITRHQKIQVLDLGARPYQEVWELQRRLQRELIDGSGTEYFLLCEHTPAVITLGRSADSSNVLSSRDQLGRLGIQVLETERGGDVTWHGPGQIVGYPILDLRQRRQDVSWYMRSLETVLIRALKCWGIDAAGLPGKPGVWIDDCRKIASLGVRISRWCTMHGFALNVRDCRAGFALINPCGLHCSCMTSIDTELGRQKRRLPGLAAVKTEISAEFLQVFEPISEAACG